MLVLEAINQVELGADGPPGTRGGFLYPADNIGSRTSLISKIYNLHRTFRMDDDPDVRHLLTPRYHMLWVKALVDITPATPEDDPSPLDGSFVVATIALARIPQQHFLQRNANALGCVASQMLIGKEEHPGTLG